MVFRSLAGSFFKLNLKVFASLVFLILSKDFIFFAVLFFLGIGYFYFQNFFQAQRFLGSFLILVWVAFSMLGNNALRVSDWFWLAAIIWSIFFLFLLGVKELIWFKNRLLYYFLNGCFLLYVFFSFFLKIKPNYFFVQYLLTGFFIFLLVKEFLSFNFKDSAFEFSHFNRSKENLSAAVISFLMLEWLWALSLLPLGFLNAASLAFLMAIILEDIFIKHARGALSRNSLLVNITLFILFTVFIVFWSLSSVII